MAISWITVKYMHVTASAYEHVVNNCIEHQPCVAGNNVYILHVHVHVELTGEELTGGADRVYGTSPHIHDHGNSVVENDTKSSVSRAPPPAPLDLSSVISSEEDHKSVPSQSDVMDILSIASKGSNVINAENLRKVQ